MLLLDLITSFYDAIDLFDSHDTLVDTLSSICHQAGFTYFAISHHGDFADAGPNLIRMHNYPSEFAAYHDAQGLGLRDPVHRMSQLRGCGFLWYALPGLLPNFGSADERVLARARRSGIGEGYTKPFHVPGERSGSCSFAVSPGLTFPRHQIPLAEALGSFTFEAARTLSNRSRHTALRSGWLTERERQIVMWLGHGKELKEIARILRISPNTVNDHLKHARARYGVHKSSLLVVCALLTGSITYSELLAG